MVIPSLTVSIFDEKIFAFDPAQFLQSLAEPLHWGQRQIGYEADTLWGLILLAKRESRPHDRYADNTLDELAPRHARPKFAASRGAERK